MGFSSSLLLKFFFENLSWSRACCQFCWHPSLFPERFRYFWNTQWVPFQVHSSILPSSWLLCLRRARIFCRSCVRSARSVQVSLIF